MIIFPTDDAFASTVMKVYYATRPPSLGAFAARSAIRARTAQREEREADFLGLYAFR